MEFFAIFCLLQHFTFLLFSVKSLLHLLKDPVVSQCTFKMLSQAEPGINDISGSINPLRLELYSDLLLALDFNNVRFVTLIVCYVHKLKFIIAILCDRVDPILLRPILPA